MTLTMTTVMTVVNATPAPLEIPDDDRLLEAALAAFGRSGYGGTSVRELTRDLAVSHNFIHQRFGSKERLWYAAVDHGFAQLAADLAATEVQPGQDALVVLRAMAVRYVASMSMRPALLRLVNTEATTPGPRLDHLHDRYIQPVCAFLESLLDRLVAEGRIRPMTVSTLY